MFPFESTLTQTSSRLMDGELIQAAQRGDLACVKMALRAGADIHAEDSRALYMAAHGGHRPLLQYLLSAGGRSSASGLGLALTAAAARGHADVVADLLRAQAGFRWQLSEALRAATENGHAAIVFQLLNHGADITTLEPYALRRAAENGYAALIQALPSQSLRPGSVIRWIHQYTADVQAALMGVIDVSELPVSDLARQGVCAEALCALLERQGQPEIATMIHATQMLEPLTPDARAQTLADLLERYGQQESLTPAARMEILVA